MLNEYIHGDTFFLFDTYKSYEALNEIEQIKTISLEEQLNKLILNNNDDSLENADENKVETVENYRDQVQDDFEENTQEEFEDGNEEAAVDEAAE